MPSYTRSDFLDVVVSADPAGPKRQKTAELKRVKARMAVVAAGLTPLGHVVVLEQWADKATTIDFIDTLAAFHTRWSPSRIGIEEAAQQGLFIDAFDYITRVMRGQHLPIVGIPVPSNQEKDYRIRTTLQPLLREGRLVVAENQLDLISEIRTFPRSALRDLVDALAQAVSMLPNWRGQRTSSLSREDEHYLAYLRATNAPADVIRRAIANCAAPPSRTQPALSH